MKAKALTVTECGWESEECRPLDPPDPPDADGAGDGPLRLPSIFKSKQAKPLRRRHSGPAHQIYHTARELLQQVLDRGAVRELVRRAAGGKAGGNRPLSKEQGAELSEEEYGEVLAWLSVVLQSGLAAGDGGGGAAPGQMLKLDGWQGVLKRNSFQNSLLSLSRLEDGDKLEALDAFCGHLARRYRALYTPGQNLAVKKYRLSHQQGPCPLHVALLCDPGSGFICNMCLYYPEQLRRRSRKPVVEQVAEHLLRPFRSQTHVVQLDRTAWMEGRVADIFSSLGLNIHFVPTVKRPAADTSDSPSGLVSHLRGWTGPGLLPLSDLKGQAVDAFLPGLWVALHTACINAFVLHSLQASGSGRQVQLGEFSRTLASQLTSEGSASVPVLPQLHSSCHQETGLTHVYKQRINTIDHRQLMGNDRKSFNIPGVCGLDNFGNSCYLNAVLQCLCSSVPLVEHLLNRDNRKELSRSRCRVAEVFVRLLEEMWLGRTSSCAPAEARSVLCSILPQFNNYSQQDAQELLLSLLNALHDNLKKVAKRHLRSSKQQKKKDRNSSSAGGEPTIVSLLFEGQLSYMTLCMHCDHQVSSTQAFTVLSLAIPTDTIKCSIQDCLSLFFEQTVLSGAERMTCSVCELRAETAVLTRLERPPEILMLHLKRFGCKGKNQVKLRTNVVFPMKLDLTQFLSGSEQNTSYSSYRLYAVVNHAGHLNMGHYTALCHNTLTRSWHRFDDSAVSEVQDGLVQSPNAYLLFYSRKPFQNPKIHGLFQNDSQ